MVRIFILLVLILYRKACHVRESGRSFQFSDSRRKEAVSIGVCTCERCLQCHRVLVSATPFWDKVIRGNSGFTFQTFVKQYESVIFPPFLEVFPFQFCKDAPFLKGMIPRYKR